MSLLFSRRRLIGLMSAAAALPPLASGAAPAILRHAGWSCSILLNLRVTLVSGIPPALVDPRSMPWTGCRVGDVVGGALWLEIGEGDDVRYDFDIAGLRSVIRRASHPGPHALNPRIGRLRFSSNTWQDFESFQIQDGGAISVEHDDIALRLEILNHEAGASMPLS